MDLDYIKTPPVIPDMTAYVSPIFTDNIVTRQFSTIENAIDYALTKLNPVVDWDEAFVIKVSPGFYTEHLTKGHRRLFIVGDDVDFTNMEHAVIIYNTGLDEDHYPIDVDEGLNLIGIGVRTESGGIFGKFIRYLIATVCTFDGGYFIENNTSHSNRTNYLRYCQFNGDGFRLEGRIWARRYISCVGCIFSGTETLFDSDPYPTQDTTKIKLRSCDINTTLQIRNKWSLLSIDTEVFGSGRIDFNAYAGDIDLYATIIHNGIHFSCDTTGEKKIVNCIYRSTPIGECDITADVDISDVEYLNNIQDHGLSGKIHIKCPVKNVGGNCVDRYYSLQEAVDSIITKGTIVIYDDIIDQTKLVLKSGIDVSFDAQRIYSITFTGDIVDIPDNSKCGFVKFATLNGGTITLNGTAAEVGFEDNQYIVGNLVLTKGAFAIIYKSSFFGSTGHKAIDINNTGTTIVVGYSRIQGSTGNPAVGFTVDADGKFKGKFSTFIHGDKNASAPIVNTAVGKVDIAVYACGLNAIWDANKFTNTIGNANNTSDTAISF